MKSRDPKTVIFKSKRKLNTPRAASPVMNAKSIFRNRCGFDVP